jgi:Ca2+-binding RTX toxin-like protein
MSSIAGNTSTTAVLTAGEIETHTIDSSGDFDWFKVTLVEGRQYSFTVSSSGGPGIGLVGPDLGLYDGNGAPLASSTTYSGATSTITFRATASGTYFVGVGDSTNNGTGQYAVTWNSADTIRDDVATTRTLIANGTVAGNLEVAADSDWFGLTMTSGLSYGIELRGATANQLVGSDIQLRDQNGNQLSYSTTYSGTVNAINHDATRTGAYFFSVNDGGNDTGGYTVNFVATDTIQNNISTTRTLARDSVQTSAIDVAGDADWFKVTMSAGLTYGFQVLSRTTNPLQWGDLELRDANGNRIAYFDTASGSTNTLAFTTLTSGTYFVTVRDTGGDTGGYSLRNIGADSVRADVATAARLVNGGSTTGRIEMLSDSDWHRIDTQQGVTYTFTLSGDGSAAELKNTTLILRDAAGNVLATDSYDPLTTLTYTATTNGPLFVEAKGYDSTDWGSYVLTAVSNAPTLTGTANADRLQGGAGATVINANAGNDWADGGAGNDRLFGSTGNDRLFGNADHDKLYGGVGNDALFGGSGNDTLEGEAGNDVLTGGTGSDRFVFRATSNADKITDFQDGADRIQIIGGPTSFAGLTLTTLGEDVRISFGSVQILVQDITRAELTTADFIFG